MFSQMRPFGLLDDEIVTQQSAGYKQTAGNISDRWPLQRPGLTPSVRKKLPVGIEKKVLEGEGQRLFG